MNFRYVRTKNEYIQFVNEVRDVFGCTEEWEDFFGFHLKWNEETGNVLETIFEYQGDIEYCPDSFPAIIYCSFNKEKDKHGDIEFNIIDFATFEELNITA